MKFLYHLLIFAAGTALGIWVGVKFPDQSKSVADTEDQQAQKIQLAVSQAKISLLNHFVDSTKEDTKAEMQQMLKDEQQKVAGATPTKTASSN
jgi:hypothetical protein